MFKFEIEYQNALTKLKALGAAATDLREFWNTVFGPTYFGRVQDGFAVQGLQRGTSGRFVAGTKWEKLTPTYRAWKSKHFPGKTILIRTGALQESVTWSGSGLGPGGYWESQPQSLKFGTTLPYGKYHQKGTKHMVARPFLPKVDTKEWSPIVKKWITTKTDLVAKANRKPTKKSTTK